MTSATSSIATAATAGTWRQIAVGVYLGILSRFPTEAESQTVEAYFKSGKLGLREATVDLAWALMNSDEFLYRH